MYVERDFTAEQCFWPSYNLKKRLKNPLKKLTVRHHVSQVVLVIESVSLASSLNFIGDVIEKLVF